MVTDHAPKAPKAPVEIPKLIFGTPEDLRDFMVEEESIVSNQQLADMYETTIKGVEEGKVVKGRILKITDNEVFVDINFKSEGVIPKNEFKNPDEIKVGEEIDIFLEEMENHEGQIILSKQRADFAMVWEKIKNSYENGEIIEGKVIQKIKGGAVVDLFGIDAFLPGSQIDLRQIPDIDSLVSQVLKFKIIKVNKSRRNIVVSRRIVLEEEREKLRAQIIDTIEKGQIREGTVKNITDFGAFIDLGGVDGLLHITDMSWGRVNHPSELVMLGEKVKVKILDFDEKKERISLGMKQLQEHPWKNITQKYPEGNRVKGKIVNITDYGAFMELEKGIEGLIHISEMSWTQHIKHPSKLVEIGDVVEALVLKLDVENEKISLGLKQIEPDPWEKIEEEFPVNSKIRGKIRNLASFGAFVDLKPGVDGLIHISDISWTKKINHPSECFKKAETVDAMVLTIDKDKRRISLGLKQLEADPWESFSSVYKVGALTEGKIVRLLDRGVVVELPEKVEGFVPNSHLGLGGTKKPAFSMKAVYSLNLKVIEFVQDNRKITLSSEEYQKSRDTEELDRYQGSSRDNKTTLGDVIDFSAARTKKE
jgi:small subunit ribosomal protein S1